jgi:hypothetical protein
MEARKPLVVDVVGGLWFADRKRRPSITRNSGTDASRDLVRKWSCCEVPETEFRSKTGSYWVVPVWGDLLDLTLRLIMRKHGKELEQENIHRPYFIVGNTPYSHLRLQA